MSPGNFLPNKWRKHYYKLYTRKLDQVASQTVFSSLAATTAIEREREKERKRERERERERGGGGGRGREGEGEKVRESKRGKH